MEPKPIHVHEEKEKPMFLKYKSLSEGIIYDDVSDLSVSCLSDFHDLLRSVFKNFADMERKSVFMTSRSLMMIDDSDSGESVKSKSLKSIEETDEEDEELLIASTSCPLLPSMIEDCNPLRIKQEEVKINKVSINDFILLKALSHGAYGKVCLAMRKKTKDIFAVKIIDKKVLED